MSFGGEEPDLAFEFVQQLSSAIEKSTLRAKQEDADAFRYRGANLKPAVERALYVSLVNNDSLYELFRASRLGLIGKPAVLGTDLEQSAARVLLSEGMRYEGMLRLSRSRVRGALGKFGRTADRLLRRADVSKVARREDKGRATRVALLVHHWKFLRFLAPVLERLGGDVLLLVSDRSLAEILTRDGRRALTLEDFGIAPRLHGRVSSALSGYRYLCRAFDRLEDVGRRSVRCLIAVEGIHPLDAIGSQACRAASIPSLCIQHGWSPIVHNGFRNMSFTKMLVWGEGFSRILSAYNPGQRFEVTGSPVLSVHGQRLLDSQLAGRHAITFFSQGASRLIGSRHVAEFAHLADQVSRRYPSAAILVRAHPSDPSGGQALLGLAHLPNVIFVPPDDYSLGEVLAATRVSVSIYSTALLESVAKLIPAVVFNCTSLPRYYPDLAEYGAGVETRDAESAVDIVGRLTFDEAYRREFRPGMMRLRDEYFDGGHEEAAERIVSAILRAPDELS